MILWSSRKLEKALAEERFSEWEKAKYYLWPAIWGALAGGPMFLLRPYYGSKPNHHGIFILVGCMLMALVTYYGIRLGYRENQNIDGKSFIERYTILSLPVVVRFVVWLIPVMVVFLFVFAGLTRSAPEVRKLTGPILRFVFPVITFWLYCQIARSVRRFGDHLKLKEESENEQS